MRKLLALGGALALGIFAVTDAVAEHIPEPDKGVVEAEARVAAFFELGDLDPMVEVRGRLEESDYEFGYFSTTLGAYYRVHRNVKVGAFYRLQLGARHDDDWMEDPTHWWWDDSLDRAENVLIADVSPRFQLSFLPGEDWVLMIKNRYELNTHNTQQTFKVRPSLTWFWIKDRQPVLNVTGAYEAYLALNFSDELLYERWIYLDLLYHVSPVVKAELSLAHRRVTWTTSEDSKENGDSYSVDYKPFVVGAGLLLMLHP